MLSFAVFDVLNVYVCVFVRLNCVQLSKSKKNYTFSIVCLSLVDLCALNDLIRLSVCFI